MEFFGDRRRILNEDRLDWGVLRTEAHALLEELVHKHVEMHATDPGRSLAALGSIGSARKDKD
jgi:hypothetical protein